MISFPDKLYDVIVADPPWQYNNKRTGGSMRSGADAQYPTMQLHEIIDLPVQGLGKKNSILFLWVTTPLKYQIARSGLLDFWGYEYRTSLYWRKIHSSSMGFWYRGKIEECWICIRGKIKPFRNPLSNVIIAPCGKHSQKPEAFWTLIEPDLSKFHLDDRIELFARENRDAWDSWGNEV